MRLLVLQRMVEAMLSGTGIAGGFLRSFMGTLPMYEYL